MAKTITNPSNLQIATELSRLNPESSYAKLLGYDKNTNTLSAKDLSLFTDTPDVANEFISDMANKIVVQRAYDLFREYKMPFYSFMKSMGRLGDVEELVSSELATLEDYGDATSPFAGAKPSIVLHWIKTEDKKVAPVRLSYEIWAGAFVNEGSLSNLAGIIIKNLADAVSVYVYETLAGVIADSGTSIAPYAVVSAITSEGETADAQTAYEKIIKTALDMSLPSTSFNTAEVKTFTPLGSAVLVLNSRYKSSFDVNVLASLFNSAEIGAKKYFKEVIMVEFPSGSDATQVGAILDSEALLWGYRINVTQSIVNPRTLEINTFYHAWIKRGVVPFRNAVRLLTAEPQP